MPLRAFFGGRELLAPLMSDEEWLNLKAQRPKVRLCCCDSTGYLRTSKLGTKHFVHDKDRICNWAPETWQHLLAKTEIVRVCQQFGYDAKTEVSGSDWRADVLATKTDRGQLIKLAFEVQWSPQTLEETAARQAKYQRDGIRCCWLFRKLPTSADFSCQDLPMFKLWLESKDALMVDASTRTLTLSEFMAALLSRHFKFASHYRVRQIQQFKVVFLAVICWRCQQQHYLYYIPNAGYYSKCGIKIDEGAFGAFDSNFWLFRPELIQAVKNYLKTEAGKTIRMGEIKKRYSKTVRRSYMSFGCKKCDAIWGDHFYFEAMSEAWYGYIPTIELDLQISLNPPLNLNSRPHWCYSPTGSFCDIIEHETKQTTACYC